MERRLPNHLPVPNKAFVSGYSKVVNDDVRHAASGKPWFSPQHYVAVLFVLIKVTKNANSGLSNMQNISVLYNQASKPTLHFCMASQQ